MAVPATLIKNFMGFQGVDYEASDLSRDPKFASELLNADFSGAQALVKRKGNQAIAGNVGGYGLAVYENINTTTGAVTETLVTTDDSLYTLVADSFNITYSGSATSLLNIGLNSNNVFELTITEDETAILTQTLGLGLDEGSATAISLVISTIDALADYAASGGTITTGSAAFLNLQKDVALTSTATAINYKRWAAANEPTANPLTTSLAQKNSTTYENPSFVSMNNVLYVSTGYDNLMKYDGQNFYRAGLPAGGDANGSGDAGVAATGVDNGAGSIADSTYYYKYLYRQVDNKGNIVEGIMSPVSAGIVTAAGSSAVDVTLTYLSDSSGFNTGCAKINGAQSSTTTLTVDSGHTLLAGDTAYFYDTVSSAYVTRVLTSVTATTIVWAAATSITVVDNAIISNNLMLSLYRTKAGGTANGVFYLVADVPNDSLAENMLYTDTKADASLGAEFIAPIKPHGLPPKCKYAVSHVAHLMLAGDPLNVNKVYYSDIDSPEYFPAGDNSFLVDAFDGAKIYGIGSLDTSFYVFKDRSVQAVTGDFSEDAFRVDDISYGQVGCAAFHTIQKVGGSLFFLSKRGIFSANAEGIRPVANRISRKITAFDVDFNFQKAVATVWADNNKYLLFLPEESQDGSSNYYANSDSKVYAYDYSLDAWLPWDGLNCQGGIVFGNESLYFMARRLDSNSSTVKAATYIVNEYGTDQDYSDHNSAIDFIYSTHWENLGEPNVFKRFLRVKVFALPNDMVDGEVPLYTLTIDQEHNFNAPAIINSFDMDFSGDTTGWGNGGWGETPWGDSALPEIKGKLKSLKSRSIRLTFSNSTILENVLISGYELECVPAYDIHIKE